MYRKIKKQGVGAYEVLMMLSLQACLILSMLFVCCYNQVDLYLITYTHTHTYICICTGPGDSAKGLCHRELTSAGDIICWQPVYSPPPPLLSKPLVNIACAIN